MGASEWTARQIGSIGVAHQGGVSISLGKSACTRGSTVPLLRYHINFKRAHGIESRYRGRGEGGGRCAAPRGRYWA